MLYSNPVGYPSVGRDGRVVDGSGLENRSGCKLTGGSNPSPSALTFAYATVYLVADFPIGEVPEWSNGAAC